jgi:anthrone oxygenase-like protein
MARTGNPRMVDDTSADPRPGQLPPDAHVRWSGRDRATHWLLLALAVVAGIQTGGVVFDSLVNDPVWSDSVVAARAWNEDIDPSRFYIAFTNGVFLLAIATLVVGWRSPRPVRGWLRLATGFFIVAVVFTMAYFLPEIQEIRGAPAQPIPDGELSDRIQRWTLLDPVRELFIFAGFVLTVRAVGLSHAAQARSEMLSEGR